MVLLILWQVVRSALHSNQTFGHLAMKLDTSGPAKQDILQIGRFRSKHRVKQAADLFETIAAAVYLQSGYWTLFDWVSSVFHQLIPIAIGAHTNLYVTCSSLPKKIEDDFLISVTTFPMVRKSRVLRPKALSNRLPGKIEKKQIHQRTSPTHDTLHFPTPYQSVANSHFDMNLSTPQTLVSVPYMYQAGPHLRVDAWFPATGIPSYPVLPILTIRHTTPEHSPIGKTMAANSPCSHTTENPHLDVAKSLPLPQEPGGAEVSVAEPCSGAHGKFDQPRRWFQALCRQFSSS